MLYKYRFLDDITRGSSVTPFAIPVWHMHTHAHTHTGIPTHAVLRLDIYINTHMCTHTPIHLFPPLYTHSTYYMLTHTYYLG